VPGKPTAALPPSVRADDGSLSVPVEIGPVAFLAAVCNAADGMREAARSVHPGYTPASIVRVDLVDDFVAKLQAAGAPTSGTYGWRAALTPGSPTTRGST
jgi:hypothetical protein